MSSHFSPPSPKLRSLKEFNADINGYIKHVEQYRKYIEMKSQMKQIEKHLLFEEHPQPTDKDSSGLNDEPSSADGIAQSLPATPFQSSLDNFIEELELKNAVFGFNNKNETTGGFVQVKNIVN